MRDILLSVGVSVVFIALTSCVSPSSRLLPHDVTQLWVSDPASNAASGHVMIFLQGGPRDFLYFVRDGRTLSRYLPDYQNAHAIYLHQAQSLNPEIIDRGLAFTLAEANHAVEKTTRMLDVAVRHFKAQGKRVSVIGHSYGAFVVVDYLSRYESLANRYVVSAGRIDIDEAMLHDNRQGLTSSYAPDGTTYIPFVEKDFSDYSARERGAYHVRGLLKAAYGDRDYRKWLSGTDLEDVYFVSGRSDQQVGTMTSAEVSFLTQRDATVILVDGGHYDVYKRMIDAVETGQIRLTDHP